MRRSREAILLAIVVGIVTGLLVRGFEWLVEEGYHWVREQPPIVGAVFPAIGLAAAALVLRWVAIGASPATSDEYLQAFHDPEYRLRPRVVVGRILASVCTLGTGGALGLEGPSLYGGAAAGAFIQSRLPRSLRGTDHRVLLVAGAAAGVAAIFKAPATGAIFALEVPFRGDMARRMLLPALVAAASGYLTFVTLSDTVPLLNVGTYVGGQTFELIDLAGALLIGITCAAGARGFSRLIQLAKRLAHRSATVRVITSSIVLALLYWAGWEITGLPISLGGGYEVFREWLFVEPPGGIALWALAAVFLIRCVAAAATYAGGGVGGLFVPLVVGGGLTGRFVAEIVHPERAGLYTLLGVAAFLGAGYRVPLAAVMFVAETTGRSDFVVPALFAAVAAELVMGDRSITAFQRTPGAEVMA